MSSSVDDVLNWTDNEFKKNVDLNQFITNNRLQKQTNVRIATCKFCGVKFAIYHEQGRPSEYCSDECRENARSDQSRIKSHRWYHKHKHRLSEKQRWGLGSGKLGQHRHKDFVKEEVTIKRELTRLKLKKR